MDGLEPYDSYSAQPLTPREHEILTCISKGLTNPQIAEELFIALSTVKWHVRQIHNKLGVSKRRDAVAAARRMVVLPL